MKNFHEQPQGFYTLLYTEMCGLYGQFSIMALLILYMTTAFKSGDNEAFVCYGAFTAFIYIVPLIGGYLTDRICGLKPVLLLGFVLMITGTIFLTLPSLNSLYIGLAIFGTGCGFFTPAITTVFGRLYDQNSKQRDNAFTFYYIVKNIGGLLAIVTGAAVSTHYGYRYVYLISAAVMLSGYFNLIFFSKSLKTELFISKQTPLPFVKSIFITTIMTALLLSLNIAMIVSHITDIFMLSAMICSAIMIVFLYYKFSSEDRNKLSIILFTIVMMIIFMMFLGQGGTTLNLFIDRIVNRTIGSYTIPPSMFYALDPVFMIVLGALVIGCLNKIKGPNQTIIGFKKIASGLFILAIGFLIFTEAASIMAHNAIKPSASYVIGAYMLFPIAELCIMPIIISLITRIAPEGHEGIMMGLYMVGIAIANYFTGVFSKIGNISFPINNITEMVMAAKIYQHTFIISALALLVAGIICWTIIIVYQRVSTSSINNNLNLVTNE